MRLSRKNQGNNVAFLDVMACGLGAVVLIFLIIKHHTEISGDSAANELNSTDVQIMETLREEELRLVREIELVEQQRKLREQEAGEREQRNSDLIDNRKRLASLNEKIERAATQKETLTQTIEALPPHQSDDAIDDRQIGEEDYLLGLKVEGRRIVLLIDRSASMTDEKLIDIITRKIRSDAEKKQGPKWQRTKRVVRWLLSRIPAASDVIVIAFNDNAEILNEGQWGVNRDPAALKRILDEIEKLAPTGATNLEAGLKAISELSPSATDIYVVTDGLPTKSLSSLGTFSSCRKNAKKVSGKCREKLFTASVNWLMPLSGKKIHVILLPLEGDPEAAPAYWDWVAKTGGILLVPARGWP